ncbi:MAG: bifunctional protein-serine/threonine kinase/phosphatase [Gammaproteobacteria bacterium]|nr:bifunctional protein-serine/threonine kinase/phosphatase [Rhodocyclaceae bacterium]MBU3908639.1 bifunctional protein-serine/threonine kinase/phosphatase [Gammaproteobacteria bacterium]MBU3988691.1 bifunctional protein-serine/threonine kinase/phosphatase [Gammaproteobacteria bacterium]MBU4004667.1 bifunctional protein-serine/threonine kinase/phosphatase [Gammaproteobacteria bacterium]MBU4021270.1 bifunctional protein-serine/threonine kinase/phosphatase [Gammaproteobacteria bacterium]
MTTSNSLIVDLGHVSLPGPRPRNEDYCAAVTPEGAELDNKGLIAAVADGVGGHANGREAAEYCVRSLLADYYATPDTWGVPQSLDKVIVSLNRWLHAHSRRARETAGMATTLSALVLRGRRYVIAHVGDTRIYRLRNGELLQLTGDHVWEHPELKNVLSRAVGLDEKLSVDYADGNLEEGDLFLIASDGVWGTLGDAKLARLLQDKGTAEELAARIAFAATENGAQDNCTALVLRVNSLPRDSLRDAVARVGALPLPPRLKPGQLLDELEVVETLHESRVTLLYRVRVPDSGQFYVLKTLRGTTDPADAAALAHEEWLARRIASADFPQVVNWPQRSHLYYLMSWHAGATLARHLAQGRHFTPTEAADLATRTLKGLATLHRLAIIHRDIKPDNLHLGADGRLRLLDLGVAAADGQDAAEIFNEINNPGTPSYMAPELLSGAAANEASDLYAVGVTLYQLLTRKYPYGEVEPFQHPKFGDPVPPTRYRPDIPEWLESVILKGVARDPAARFETAEEFLLALERGAQRPLRVARRTPLMQRDPQFGLKLLAAGSLVLNILLLAFLLIR